MAQRSDRDVRSVSKESRIVYAAPTDQMVLRVSDVAYRLVDGEQLLSLDIYRPAEVTAPLPAVVFIHGDASPDVIRGIKDWGQYVSWGELLASNGIAAVIFNHRSSQGGTHLHDVTSDINAALDYVASNADAWNLDIFRVGLWSCSMGVPFALRVALSHSSNLRCLVALYGPMQLLPGLDALGSVTEEALREFSALHQVRSGRRLPPLFVGRAGRDHVPGLNDSIDSFVTSALEWNLEIDLLNHPSGEHGFDVRNDCRRSREMIEGALSFYRRHL